MDDKKGTNSWVENAVEEQLGRYGRSLIGLSPLGHHDDHLRPYLSPSLLLAGTDPGSFKVGHASWYLCNNYNFLSFAEAPGFSFLPQIHFLPFRYPISHALLQKIRRSRDQHIFAQLANTFGTLISESC